MIDLFLPLIVGIGLGIEPPEAADMASGTPETASATNMAVEATTLSGSGDDLDATRTPEPQVPTGKFTTAVEIRPILGMTKSNWVAVREFDGQDLVYFTHLMGWRCGLWDIRYGLNGNAADNVVAMEPCYDDMAAPNVMQDVENYLPYVAYPLGSVDSVYVEIVYDDGTTDFAQFDRAEIQIP